MATTAFQLNPELTAIAIGYRNPDLAMIADRVLPRVVKTAKRFAYTSFPLAEAYTLPATRVGRKSEPTMVDFTGSLVTAECVDWGLDDLVPNDEIEAWDLMVSRLSGSGMGMPGGSAGPMQKATSLLTSLVMLDREQRVANAVFSTANYAAGQFATLSGTSQWSDFANSNPLNAMLTAMDVPIFRPNMVVMGQAVWTQVRQHPRLIQAANASAQTGGAITKGDLANLLEIPEQNVLIGAGFVNTARRGQTPTVSRVWGKSCALLYVSQEMADADQPTYGFTAQYGDKIAGIIDAPVNGLRGGQRVRVGESVLEVISAPASGYLYSAAVA